ncbi:hypothetical protein BGZ76_004052 [Entomortierella beljakovae]|nr:hypothetical protein BGZ76_004052 [Entomortierella beljakovae]
MSSATSIPSTPLPRPKVLIIGGGLGGLTFALLLEKANIEYEIYERSSVHRALGSAIALSPNVMPLMEQLGLLKELEAISKPVEGYKVYNENEDEKDITPLGGAEMKSSQDETGYYNQMMSRPELHKLLVSKVPAHKIFLGKRVISISQDGDNRVLIRTGDGSTHYGDILVGCDGVYSGVRQSLYKMLEKNGELPPSDAQDLKVCNMSITGTSNPIDKEVSSHAHGEWSRSDAVIGYNKNISWRHFIVPENRICWRVDVQLFNSTFDKTDGFTNSDWGSESTGFIKEEWRNFLLPAGPDSGTVSIGYLIDNTEPENVTKVLLEEKLYTIWHHGRIVLMGDACHKMLPSAGRGAINAMLDAVILANELHEIADRATGENINHAFQEYYKERYPAAKSDLHFSQQTARILSGQTWFDGVLRKVLLTYLPLVYKPKPNIKLLSYRPQANFIEKIPNRGTIEPQPQKESEKSRPAAI